MTEWGIGSDAGAAMQRGPAWERAKDGGGARRWWALLLCHC